MSTHAAPDGNDAVSPPAALRAYFAIPLLALFIVHPLIVHGCSCGHDFDFHLVSWFEAATQISHGNLHPHWAFTPAWDAGEPRFVFYPPLSWYLGALLGLALTHIPHLSEVAAWSSAPVLFTWIALTLSGLTMYRLARRYANANAALIAALVYMANPYMLFTAYERTAYGELLAAAWMPLLFEAVLRERISIPRIALPVALLWLTNVPAAVMACYALALLAVIRLVLGKNAIAFSNALRSVAGAALGFCLAAFYLLPAVYEHRFVQSTMAMIGGMKIDANFLFEHTGNSPDDLLHDQVLRTASWIAVLLIAVTAAALIAAWHRRRELPRSEIAPLAALVAVIAFLLAPFGAPIWHHAPELVFLQFPWRLLALVTPVLALALAGAFSVRSSPSSSTTVASPASAKALLAALLIAAALTLPGWHLFRQPCDPEDTAAARIALFHSNVGTDPTDEYTPVTADNDALQPGDPSWWLADSLRAAAPHDHDSSALRTAPSHLTIDARRPEFLVLNLRDYPAWRILLTHNGAPPHIVPELDHRADGLIAFPVPSGSSTIDIHYSLTLDQSLGYAISLIAVVATAILMRRRNIAPSTVHLT